MYLQSHLLYENLLYIKVYILSLLIPLHLFCKALDSVGELFILFQLFIKIFKLYLQVHSIYRVLLLSQLPLKCGNRV